MQSPQLKNKRIVYKILILIHPSLHEYNWYPIKSKMRQNFTKKQTQIQTSDQERQYFLPGLERGLGCKRKPVQFCNPYILAIKKRTQSASLIILSEFTANTKILRDSIPSWDPFFVWKLSLIQESHLAQNFLKHTKNIFVVPSSLIII